MSRQDDGVSLAAELDAPTTVPCANCGLPVDLLKSRSIYCSELCNQVARAVRYVRACTRDGRINDPKVAEAIRTQLAFIPTGGYPTKARRLRPDVRAAVTERDGHRCQECGAEGNEIDHIHGSSADLSNLRLLCHECHMRKTQAGFVPASSAVIKAVFRPFDSRVALDAPRQPSDSEQWSHVQWKRTAQASPASLRGPWATWLRGLEERAEIVLYEGRPLSNPMSAVQGFPIELDPWAWYGVS